MSDILNPGNPVAEAAEGQWHKLCAILMHKLKMAKVEITPQDIAALINAKLNIGIEEEGKNIVLKLLNPHQTKEALAKYRHKIKDN